MGPVYGHGKQWITNRVDRLASFGVDPLDYELMNMLASYVRYNQLSQLAFVALIFAFLDISVWIALFA